MAIKKLESRIKDGTPVEHLITGKGFKEWDKAVRPIKGQADLLKLTKEGYSDAKMATRFAEYIPFKKEILEEADKILSSEKRDTVCPKCGGPVSDEARFCKFCGVRFKTDENLGARIQELRNELGLTLAELSNLISINPTTISLWETGDKSPSAASLEVISEKLGCSISRVAEGFDIRSDLTPVDLIQDEDEYECPHCHKPVYLSIGESLSQDIETYEDTRLFSDGNDGHFCIHCGQAIKRPVERDEKREFESYRFWLEQAIQKARARVSTRRSIQR